MGIIADRLEELEPELTKINRYVNELHEDLFSYDRQLIKGIEKRFAVLKPFRYKSKEIFVCGDKSKLALGRGIRMKTQWRKDVGSALGMRFLEIIKEYSGPIILNVRKPIKETFISAINIISDIKTLERDISLPLATKKLRNRVIALAPHAAYRTYIEQVFFMFGAENQSFITFPRTMKELTAADLAIAEDIIGDIVALYADAYGKVQSIKEHNAVKLKELDDLFTPYMVAEKLSK